MAEESFVLRKHQLKHLPELKVRSTFFGKQFSAGCSMMQCNADCCRFGVMLDPADRDKILAHKELVVRHMEPHMEKDPDHWFEAEHPDGDFPSGRAAGTQARDYGCVFLDSKGLCVLQKAALAEGMPKFSLKPFYCVAYPVTIEDGELMIDDADFVDRETCCTTVKNGTLTVFDICSEELEYMLGEEGMKELQGTSRL